MPFRNIELGGNKKISLKKMANKSDKLMLMGKWKLNISRGLRYLEYNLLNLHRGLWEDTAVEGYRLILNTSVSLKHTQI